MFLLVPTTQKETPRQSFQNQALGPSRFGQRQIPAFTESYHSLEGSYAIYHAVKTSKGRTCTAGMDAVQIRGSCVL